MSRCHLKSTVATREESRIHSRRRRARFGSGSDRDADIDRSLANLGVSTIHAVDDPIELSLGMSTSLGERFHILRPHARAAWARFSSLATRSFIIAMWP